MNLPILPCCFFPTTVVSIDDSTEFLKLVQFSLGLNGPCRVFDNPDTALKYLLTEYKHNSFVKDCVTRFEEEDMDSINVNINLKEIHRQIYNLNHYNEISVILVDYTMPNMSGDEVCRQLKNTLFKVILLTGEADEQEAINLFNKGVIDRYIRKDSSDYLKLLKQAIQVLQFEYFCDLSKIVNNNIEKKAGMLGGNFASCLTDPVFIEFFLNFFQTKSLVEFYLIEESGSMLLLTRKGEISWLLVKTEGDMEAAYECATFPATKMSPETRDAITKRDLLIHHFGDGIDLNEPDDWQKVLYPASLIKGRYSNYYYSYVQNPYVAHNIILDEVASYQKFFSSGEARTG
jgi:CheY-like chemotaxis protein